MRLFSIYLIGLVFGFGIAISGMMNPAKVLNFFDFFGTWDPSLALVMGGALGVTYLGYRFVFKRSAPLFEPGFNIPKIKDIDGRLVVGSAFFGIGWGLSGFCPGGVLPAISTLQSEVLLFVASMIAGLVIAQFLQRWNTSKPEPVKVD